MDGDLPSLKGSPTNPGMVTHQPKDGHPPEGSVLQTWNLALKLNQIHKRKPGNNFRGWSPTIPRMVTHLPKDGHPPEGSVLGVISNKKQYI